MQKNKLWLAIAISTYSVTATAVNITAEIAPGYDDNPFRLTDSFDPESGWFLNTKLKLEHKADKIRLRGQLANRAYESEVDDADVLSAKLDGRYRTKYEIGGKKTSSHVMVHYAHKDKTYVARSTGQIGTYLGNDIPDRYDYNALGIKAKTSVKFTKALKVGLQLDFLNKDYEDYDISGLSDLDYDQIGLTNDWTYKLDKQSKFSFDLNIAKRDFDDKREKDLLGNNIAGTDLEYDFRAFAIGYERNITDKLELSLGYSYEERRDSGEGYYDTDDSRISAKIHYKADDTLKFTAGLTYQDKEYINSTVFDENDEGEPSKDGYTIKLGLNKQLASVKKSPSSLIAGIRYDDYDSNDIAYEYDRFQLYAGVKIGLGQLP